MTQKLVDFICQRCGGELEHTGESSFVCRHCGRQWERESVDNYEKIFETIEAAFREQRRADLAALARRRYAEAHKEFVSNIELKQICNQILNLNPDDFYAQFYLATCKNDYSLEDFLSAVDIEKHYYDIEDMLGYLIRGLQARWINAVSTFIEKAYKSNDIAKYNLYRTKFEEMADDVEEGLFEPTLERDIFVAYSSQDMEKVNELVRVLESENELSCFVAARNLRHGSGAVENYREAIYTAMGNCKAVVFVSSESSRRLRCEAKSELDYIKANLPEMWRIELLAENYVGKSIERNFISFFDGLEYCTSPQQVADRYIDKLLAEENAEAELIAKKQAEAEEEKRRFEEETRRKLEAEFAAKMQAEAEARRKAEAEAAEARRNAEAEAKRRAEAEAEAKRRAEAEAEAKRRAEAEAEAKRRAEAEAKRKAEAEAEAKRRAEAEAKRKAEAEAEAKRRAEAERIAKEKAEAEPAAPPPEFEIENGVLKKYNGTGTNVIIPEDVTAIGNNAFYGCKGLVNVTVPEDVKSIGDYAFYGCEALKNIIVKIGRFSFVDASSLTSISIPSSVTSIGKYAFSGCKCWANITIPSGVTSIGECAFNGCTNLKTIYCKAAQKPSGWNENWRGNCTAEVVWGYKSANEQKSAASEKPKTVYVEEKVPFQRQREEAAKSASANPEFLIDNGVLLEYSGEGENVVIPEGVTAIGSGAFAMGVDTLKSVSMPKSVTSIREMAFWSCTALQSIKIPAGVIFVGEGAFDGCDGLQTIYCETAQKPVGWDKDWLGSCNAKVVWGYTDTKKDEPKELFSKLTIEEGILKRYEGNAKSVEIPGDVRVIGAHAFQGCTTLKSIKIPAGVKSIGNHAFCGCEGLTDITIPSGVTAINEGAFSTCENLKSVTLSNGVTSIGKDAFFMCGSLENISITDNVNSIGSKAFYGCGGLKSITIPSSVGTIEESVFSLCDNLQTIYCEAAQKPAGWHNNWLGVCSAKVIWGYKGAREPEKGGDGGYEAVLNKYWDNFWSGDVLGGAGGQKKEETNSAAALPASPLSDFEIENGVLKKYKGSAENVVIPSSVTSIGNGAFERCSVVNITIPNSVTRINYRAFFNCDALVKINIPNGVVYIGAGAFDGCKSLRSIDIPASVTSISDWTFRGCKGLKNITLSEGLKSIGPLAFSQCSSVTTIYIPKSVVSIERFAFSHCDKLRNIYCKVFEKPEGWADSWIDSCPAKVVWNRKETAERKNDSAPTAPTVSPLSDFTIENGVLKKYKGNAENVVIPNSVKNIGDYAFTGCSGLANVSVPDGVTTIGNQAFWGCNGLKSINIPNGVTFIGALAFHGCAGLTSISIPNSVKIIGASAFLACSSLTSVSIPNSITSIGENVFYNCKSLKSINIPNNVTTIDYQAFYGCSGLANINIPNNVTSIETNAFLGCDGLTSIRIPSSVKSVGESIFRYCKNLKTIYCEAKKKPWGWERKWLDECGAKVIWGYKG